MANLQKSSLFLQHGCYRYQVMIVCRFIKHWRLYRKFFARYFNLDPANLTRILGGYQIPNAALWSQIMYSVCYTPRLIIDYCSKFQPSGSVRPYPSSSSVPEKLPF